MSNTLGKLIRLTTFGESHGKAVGGILDGLPAGMELDIDLIQKEIDRRAPGQSSISTPRKEKDKIQILSGVLDSMTLGTPIGFIFENSDTKSKDYDALKETFRPSHADLTWERKFGMRDHRGGGRSSARETVSWVAAGAIVKPILAKRGIEISSYVSAIGRHQIEGGYPFYSDEEIDKQITRCPEKDISKKMIEAIEDARDAKDSLGGVINCVVKGLPMGLGEPIFDKLGSRLGGTILGLNAVKGIEFGSGFRASGLRGSESNDEMEINSNDAIHFKSNNSGGLLGGMSSGADLCFRVAFKPTASIGKEQDSINSSGQEVKLKIEGRHDPCVVPRAVPIIKALTSLVLADFIQLNSLSKF